MLQLSPLDVQKFRLYVRRKKNTHVNLRTILKFAQNTLKNGNYHEQIYVQPEILHSLVPAGKKVVKSVVKNVRHQIQTPDK